MQDSFSESPESEGLEAVKGFVSLAMRWFTTTLSIGLVIGIVFWSYRLGVRDASELPVIRALNEPARSRPEDPGGEVADNQGLEVNEVLAGEEASIPDSSRTAPPPVALIDEDQPPGPVDLPHGNDPVVVFDPFNNRSGTGEAQEAEEQPGIIIIEPSDPNRAPATDQAARDREEAERLAREQAEREEAARLARETAEREEAERQARELAEREEAERLARESQQRAESERAARQQQEADREAAEIARREEEAREIQEALERALREQQEAAQPAQPNPNVRVQLGTFDTEIGALGHLQELTSLHGDLLASRRLSVQKVTSGNRVEFRIRASGFQGTNETTALCQALRARGVDCVQIGG